MARLFGFISNRHELGPRVLLAQAEHLRVKRTAASGGVDSPLGWGVGFHQFGEVLLRRRPLDERPEIDLSQVIEGLKTDVLIGHVRQPTVGALRTENTHPFRYRQWLFAQTGTIEGFEQLRERLLDAQPAFLRPNLRGDTDSELFFYLFLSTLHDEGHLNGHQVPLPVIYEALRATFRLVDGLCDEANLPRHKGDALLTNGEHLIAIHRSGKLASLVLEDAGEIDALLNPDSSRNTRVSNVDQLRCTVFASELDPLPSSWQRAPMGSFIAATRTAGPVSEAI
ncbi:MAG TPA: class II glutamine amidotransferase [Polyangiaceae bacterium]|jgi:glutamine amidotransferase|nr:class II glutamine amidotransferase [Polyangiaceae bacterium]